MQTNCKKKEMSCQNLCVSAKRVHVLILCLYLKYLVHQGKAFGGQKKMFFTSKDFSKLFFFNVSIKKAIYFSRNAQSIKSDIYTVASQVEDFWY